MYFKNSFGVGVVLCVFLFQVSVQAKSLNITMVGDIGFNKNNVSPHPDYVTAYDRRTPWASLTANIAHLIDGDINFGNIETVVTDVPLSLKMEKKFKFQSHPNSIVHLADIGFNLFSLANNHMADYGYAGLESTYAWMNEISRVYPVYHHGLGVNEEIARPTIFRVKGVRVAFMAIGIDGFGLQNFPATSNRIGSMNFRSEAHRLAALRGLRDADVDLRILSIHTGTEGQVALDNAQKESFRDYVDRANVDIVIGHHPHVARAVEVYNGKLIAYSLGNFLLIGAANMDNKAISQSYGLMLKAKANITRQGVSFSNIQAIPVRNMHYAPYPVMGEEGQRILNTLNAASQKAAGANAVLF